MGEWFDNHSQQNKQHTSNEQSDELGTEYVFTIQCGNEIKKIIEMRKFNLFFIFFSTLVFDNSIFEWTVMLQYFILLQFNQRKS